MEIRGRCPACQAKFKVGAKYVGKKLPCPKCHAIIDIPRQSLDESTTAAPPVAGPPPAPPPLNETQAQEGPTATQSEFTILVSSKKGKASRLAGPRRPLGGNRRLSPAMVLGGGVAALVFLAAVTIAVVWWPSARSQGSSVAKVAASKAKVRSVSPARETNLSLPASQQSRTSRTAAGTPTSREFPAGTAPATVAIPGFDGWLQSMELAKRQAVEEKKDIVIVFGCSDTQPATQQLARALQEPAAQQATAEMVRVVIDFPRTPAGNRLIEDWAQNRQLFEEFALERLPALGLADSQGRAYWLVRKFDGGYENLAAHLAEWQSRKAVRDGLLAAATPGSAEEQLAAAAKAIEWLHEHELWTCYREEIGDWLKLAQRVDPENKKAILEAFFEPNWILQVAAIDRSDGDTAGQVAAELDPWISRKFQDPDRGAKLHLVAARLLQSARRFEDGLKQLEHATGYQPLDAKLVEALRDVRQILEHRDVLGTGTGFLVSSAGYVLTNQHVVAGEGQIVVRIPGVKEPAPAALVAHDDDRDIALLKVKLPEAEKYQPLALNANGVRRGAAVAGFGYPLGDTLGTGLKLSAGTVSAVPDESNHRYLLDLTVNPGNSGGPLCDRRGNVVGMISEKTGSEGITDSYGLAIPAADLIKFLDRHLPPSAKRPTADTSETDLGWDKVDERVSSGVLMIVKKK